MAFPTVTGSILTELGSGSSASVNLPSTLIPGQLLVVLHRSAGAGAHGWPADWTTVQSSADGSDDVISVGWKNIGQVETGVVTITQGNVKYASLAYAIAGACDPAIQAPELSTVATGAGTTPDPTIVTPTGGAKDYLFLWLGGWEGEQTSPPASQPTSYTNPIGASSGTAAGTSTNCRVASARRALNAASQDPGSWTISVSEDWTAWAMAIHPPPPGGEEKPVPIFRPKKGYF